MYIDRSIELSISIIDIGRKPRNYQIEWANFLMCKLEGREICTSPLYEKTENNDMHNSGTLFHKN